MPRLCCAVSFAGIIGLGLGACSSAPAASPAPRGPVVPAGKAPVALPAGVGEPRSTLLIGDLHGTREIPAFVGQLVTTLSAKQPVVLALEIPREVAPLLDVFMTSDGGRAARDALTAAPWWQDVYQDGRRSTAMLGLIDTARRLRVAGANVMVGCVDMPAKGDDGRSRDAAIAEQVMALRTAQPAAVLVVYVGDFHTRKLGPPDRPDYETMAIRLAKGGLATLSLDAHWDEGSAWVCMNDVASECGPQFMASRSEQRGIHVERTDDGAYDGWFGVGAITASPPAGFPELAAKLDAQLAGLSSSPSARRSHARRAHRAKRYAECAESYAHIASPTATDIYKEACCLALAGNKDAAFERLRTAIELGYPDAAGAEADGDLAALRGDPRWPFAKRP